MKYRANWKPKNSRETINGPIWGMESAAIADANEAIRDGATFARILYDTEGSDHPDNAGKFFLLRYILA